MLHERIVTPIRAMLRDVGVDVQDVKLAVLREHRSQMGEWDPTEMMPRGRGSRASGGAWRPRRPSAGWC